jgi:hypothetical protein
MPCSICQTRKEKRFCPAVHDRICAVCCGTEREVTLDCPSDCPYLQQARAHEKPRSSQELEAAGAELFRQVELSQDFTYQHEPLIVGLCSGIHKVARADRQMHDRDVIAALTNLAHTYERMTRSGLQYEEPTAGVAQMTLIGEIHRMIAEYRELEQKHLGYVKLRDLEVLRAFVFLVRMAHSRTSGRPRSRAFLDFLAGMFPDKTSPLATPGEQPSRIIIP